MSEADRAMSWIVVELAVEVVVPLLGQEPQPGVIDPVGTRGGARQLGGADRSYQPQEQDRDRQPSRTEPLRHRQFETAPERRSDLHALTAIVPARHPARKRARLGTDRGSRTRSDKLCSAREGACGDSSL